MQRLQNNLSLKEKEELLSQIENIFDTVETQRRSHNARQDKALYSS